MDKICVDLKVRLVIQKPSNGEVLVSDVINDMDYNFFYSGGGGANIVDTEISGYEVVDSK